MVARIAWLAAALPMLALLPSAAALGWRDVVRFNLKHAGNDSPAFCHGLDCPEYEVLNSTDAYETREYKKAEWALTHVDNSGFTFALTKGFARLFEYISGANEDSTKIKMTAPVSLGIPLGSDRKPTGNYTVAFFMPPKFKGDAPKPSSDDVELVKFKSIVLFAKSFGGFATEATVLKEAAALGVALAGEGIRVNTDLFLFASYDPPYRLTGRHNEVLLSSH